MTEREKDLKRLDLFICGRPLPAVCILIIMVCTVTMFVMASNVAARGDSTLILPALLSIVAIAFMVIQHFMAGPLIREVQRLRADLEEFRNNKRDN